LYTYFSSAVNDHQPSQLLQSDSNCNLKILNKNPNIKRRLNNEFCKKDIVAEKENINAFVPIYSSDFLSDDESFKKHDSPPSVMPNLVKVQNSPIISKCKRLSSKKNDLISNSSGNVLSSSSESKASLAMSNAIKKNINEIENESYKACEKINNNKPLKSVESMFESSIEDNKNKNEGYKILSISKNNYGKSEFLENGKKLRQTKLTLKKVTSVIDISKHDSNGNLNSESETKYKKENTSDETFFIRESIRENAINHKEDKKNVSVILNGKRENDKLQNAMSNKSTWVKNENKNKSLKDDELIETSPVQIEKSKLRDKLNKKKKPNAHKIEVKTINILKQKENLNLKNNTKDNGTHNNDDGIIEITSKSPQFNERNLKNRVIAREKQKKLFLEKSCNDETYFSPVERIKDINDGSNWNVNVNTSKFKDEMKYEAPPAKKMLLNSFDV
jgi:hypothetical protein